MTGEGRMKTMGTGNRIFLVLLALTTLCVPSASALTIITNFIGGAAPPNTAGGGNIADIVNAAARIWEAAYPGPETITINYGWAPVGDAATHSLTAQGGTPDRETAGVILFDNSGAIKFFLDPTPLANEEFRRRTEEYQDLGGGFVNVARLYTSPLGDAAGHTDLLSVALHEMGHALGICAANDAFRLEAVDGTITIAEDLPFAGTQIPLATNKSGITSHFDAVQVTYGSVMAGISGDERRLPSALDVLVNAQISGYRILDLDPAQLSPSRVLTTRTPGRVENGASAGRSTVR